MAKKPAVKKTPEVKKPVVTTAKVEVEKKVEVKPTEVKKEDAKAEAVKDAAAIAKEVATAVKGTATKTAKKTTKKAAKEKVVLQPEVILEYHDDGEQKANVNDIVARVKALYVADGHRESSIKSLQIYMKPQEWKAYYVINGKITGDINLF